MTGYTDPGGGKSKDQVQGIVAELVAAGDKLSVAYDDENGVLTVDTSALDAEEVESAIASVVTGGTSITATYDDANGTLTLDGPSDAYIQDVIGNSLGSGLKYDSGANVISATGGGLSRFDAAQTFTESDVSLGFNGTQVSGGSVQLGSGQSSTVQPGAYDSENTYDGSFGWAFTPNVDLQSVTVTVGSNTTGFSEAVILDGLNSELDTKSVSGFSGEQITFNYQFDAGVQYAIAVNDQSNQYTYGRYNGNFPQTSDVVDVNNGWSNGFNDNWVYSFESLTATSVEPSSGSVTVEWPTPTDLYGWDTATYTETQDGETVDVYVAYSTDGGSSWTRSNGGTPISRNYSLADDPNIDASTEVRLEAELSRADTANNPSLDSAYRSWFL